MAGNIQPMCSKLGHSWQGHFFSSKTSPKSISYVLGILQSQFWTGIRYMVEMAHAQGPSDHSIINSDFSVRPTDETGFWGPSFDSIRFFNENRSNDPING